MIEDVVKNWRGAAIEIQDRDGSIETRAAAFVYDAPGGFAFMSPAYLDPWAGSNLGHVIEARLTIVNDSRIEYAGPRYRGAIVADEEDRVDDVGVALYEFDSALDAAGLTWEGERERLRALI